MWPELDDTGIKSVFNKFLTIGEGSTDAIMVCANPENRIVSPKPFLHCNFKACFWLFLPVWNPSVKVFPKSSRVFKWTSAGCRSTTTSGCPASSILISCEIMVRKAKEISVCNFHQDLVCISVELIWESVLAIYTRIWCICLWHSLPFGRILVLFFYFIPSVIIGFWIFSKNHFWIVSSWFWFFYGIVPLAL